MTWYVKNGSLAPKITAPSPPPPTHTLPLKMYIPCIWSVLGVQISGHIWLFGMVGDQISHSWIHIKIKPVTKHCCVSDFLCQFICTELGPAPTINKHIRQPSPYICVFALFKPRDDIQYPNSWKSMTNCFLLVQVVSLATHKFILNPAVFPLQCIQHLATSLPCMDFKAKPRHFRLPIQGVMKSACDCMIYGQDICPTAGSLCAVPHPKVELRRRLSKWICGETPIYHETCQLVKPQKR